MVVLTDEPKRMVWKRTKRRLGGYKPEEQGWKPPSMRTEKASTARSGYPKCVPRAKANRMSSAEKRSAVRRKRAKAQGWAVSPQMLLQTLLKKQKEQHTGVRFIPVVAPQDGRCTDVKKIASIRQ